MPDYVDGCLAQEVVLGVRECLGRGYHYAFARVYAKGIEILHVAHGDAVVVAVAHYLVFYLLPTLEGFLYEYLVGEGEGFGGNRVEFAFVVAETGTQASQCVCSTHDYRISKLACSGSGFCLRGCRMRTYGVDAYLVETVYEKLAVLGVDDGLDRRSEHFHAITLQHSATEKFDSAVEGGLPSERQQYALGTFFLYYFFDEGWGDRQEVYLVGNAFRGLYGCDVGVYENCGQPFLAQGLQGLRSAVIELSGFSDLECSGTEDKDFFQCAVCHSADMNSSNRNSVSVGPLDASGWNCAEKKGLLRCLMPSEVPSLRLMK